MEALVGAFSDKRALVGDMLGPSPGTAKLYEGPLTTLGTEGGPMQLVCPVSTAGAGAGGPVLVLVLVTRGDPSCQHDVQSVITDQPDIFSHGTTLQLQDIFDFRTVKVMATVRQITKFQI